MKVKLTSLLLIVILTVSATAQTFPTGDLNEDYIVDILDMQIMAGQWLDFAGCEGFGCPEFDGVLGITLSDYDYLAANWLEDFRDRTVVINEFMASNSSASGITDPQGDSDDWIEIYNMGEAALDLAGKYLTDDLNNPTVWQFPPDRPSETTIAAGGYLVVWADGEIGDTPGLHAGFQLNAGGEEIGLFDTDGTTLIDSIVFGDQVGDISYGRWPDGYSDWRFFPTATPGAANDTPYIGEVADTKFSSDRGFYDDPFSLTITCDTAGAQIYYTTDGTAPVDNDVATADGILYTGPISISSNTSVRAAALKTGWMPTNLDTHTYIFDASDEIKAMPVVCLTGDEEKTFFLPDGIMAYPTLRGIEYERPVSFEVIDLQTGASFHENCGIRLHGSNDTRPQYTIGEDWSTCWIDWWPHMNTNKLGFNLWFRSTYGNNRLEYPFFPFIDVDRFKSLVLRQGKNDACTPFIKDEWARRLFREMGHVQVTGSFANLYLNGEYKSYYNPTARGDQEFYQEWYGTENEFDVITQSGVRDGDSSAWYSLINYANSNDLSDITKYEYVASKFDIPTFIDFLIIEIHIGNFDWPGNNWDVHCERSADGIFRFSIWDAEGLAEQWYFGGGCENCADTAFEDFPTWSGTAGLNHMNDPISQLYRALKANPEFVQLFADHVHKHFWNSGILSEEHLLMRWWEVFAELSDVLPYAGPGVVTFVPDVFIPLREMYTMDAFEANNLIDLSFGYPIFNINSSYQHGG
ncbi:MAG: lamin tail domain-containing protein, partial [Sedimentisphaerales bacterium]|nr:lamin tail domain-containing protein [Sedimentisphaerales bacterium]